VLDHQHAPAALARRQRAHQAGGAAADHDHICGIIHATGTLIGGDASMPAESDQPAMLRLTEIKLPLDHPEDALQAAILARLGIAGRARCSPAHRVQAQLRRAQALEHP
jgi:hypothetical protein